MMSRIFGVAGRRGWLGFCRHPQPHLPSHTKTRGKALFTMRYSLWRLQSSVVHQRENHLHRLNHAHHHLALGTPRLSKWCHYQILLSPSYLLLKQTLFNKSLTQLR